MPRLRLPCSRQREFVPGRGPTSTRRQRARRAELRPLANGEIKVCFFKTGVNRGEKLLRNAMYALHNGVGTDYVSGEPLKGEMVMAAWKLELELFEKMGVYTRVTRARALASGNGKVIQGRWIDVNKGSSETPDYRSRYVGKEFNRGQVATPDLFAATPPLEALKLLVSTCATEKGRGTHLMLSDVKRTHFHAPATRELYVELPD